MLVFFENNKAISSVVATALLLVVAVISVVGFQGWFTSFSSGLIVDVDTQTSSNSNSIKVEGIINDVLYLNSKSSSELSLLSVVDSSGVEQCSFSGGGEVNNSGLVGHWKFDDNSAIITDFSGNGNDGKLYGNSHLILDFDDSTAADKTSYNNTGVVDGSYYNSSCGVSGGCFEFDGIDDTISFTNVSELELINLGDYVSVSFWLKVPESSLGIEMPFSFNGGYSLSISGTQDWFGFNTLNGDYYGFDFDLFPKNEWVHIVGIFVNGISYEGKNKIFLNGVEQSLSYRDSNLQDNNKTISSIFNLGSRSGGVNYNFNGSIDEVGIYSKALSLNEVKDLYNSKKAKFIEFTDSGLEFDGVDDFVEVVNISSLISPYNWSMFVNVKVSSYFEHIAAAEIVSLAEFESPWNSNYMFRLYGSLNPNPNELGFNLRGNNPQSFSVSNPVDLNTFNSYFGTFNSETLSLKGYANGVLFENNTATSWVEINSSNYKSLKIGSGYNNYYFNGVINEVKIFNRTLSQIDIDSLYFDSINSQSIGINKIDLSSCNLDKGKKYNVVGAFGNSVIDVEVITK